MNKAVNYKKATGYACPLCGGMLEYLFREDRRGRKVRYEATSRHKKRLASDDVEVDKIRKISAYESKKVGVEYLHTVKFCCPACSCVMSEGQAVAKTFAEHELPRDYYVSGEPVFIDPDRIAEDALASMRSECRSRSPDAFRSTQGRLDL